MHFFSYERFFQTKLFGGTSGNGRILFLYERNRPNVNFSMQSTFQVITRVTVIVIDWKVVASVITLKTDIKVKERMKDLMNLDESIEHQWIQIAGQKKSFNIIISNFYQTSSKLQDKLAFLKKFEKLLAQVTILHNDRLKKSVETERYTDILDAFHLIQHGTQPTRKSKSLINHIISTQDSTSNCLIMT